MIFMYHQSQGVLEIIHYSLLGQAYVFIIVPAGHCRFKSTNRVNSSSKISTLFVSRNSATLGPLEPCETCTDSASIMCGQIDAASSYEDLSGTSIGLYWKRNPAKYAQCSTGGSADSASGSDSGSYLKDAAERHK